MTSRAVGHEPPRFLKASADGSGYPTVCLDGVTMRVHVLLAEAFVRPRAPGEIVRHLDARRELPTAWTVGLGSSTDNEADKRLHAAAALMATAPAELVRVAAALLELHVRNRTAAEVAARFALSSHVVTHLRARRRYRSRLRFLYDVLALLESDAPVVPPAR